MTLDDFVVLLEREEKGLREGLSAVIGDRPDGPAVVGKHEAINHVHLRTMIASAQESFPEVAETLRWLLWHRVVNAQRLSFLARDVRDTLAAPDPAKGPDQILREGFPAGWFIEDRPAENTALLCGPGGGLSGTRCICQRPKAMKTQDWIPIAQALARAACDSAAN